MNKLLNRWLRPTDLVMDGVLYMRRYHLTPRRWKRELRVHHILADDLGRCLHDHPWDFVSIGLKGAYLEEVPAGRIVTPGVDTEANVYRAPFVIRRKAEDLHRLILATPSVWTLVYAGPERRMWGFLTPTGWVPWEQYDVDAYGGAQNVRVIR